MNDIFRPAHVMLDLETLGTRPGDTILSIGAVQFDEEGLGATFYRTISIQSSKDLGFKAQKSTIEWWDKQDPDVKAEAFGGVVGIENVLTEFNIWLPQEARVWGNGANFDNVLLAAAYRITKQEAPWKFWNDRCYRTFSAHFLTERVERTGKHHNALDDAKTQAERLIHMAKKHGITLK